MKETSHEQMDAFFHINRDENKVEMIRTEQGDLDDFIQNLTKQIIDNDKSRHFKFNSEHKEVISLLNCILAGENTFDMFYDYTQKIANRLLHTEIKTQARQGDFNELQKGSLIISKYKS